MTDALYPCDTYTHWKKRHEEKLVLFHLYAPMSTPPSIQSRCPCHTHETCVSIVYIVFGTLRLLFTTAPLKLHKFLRSFKNKIVKTSHFYRGVCFLSLARTSIWTCSFVIGCHFAVKYFPTAATTVPHC